ncbi:type II toxin-antitoxin system RelE/ParE family toxin [Mycobacterium heidelbergense]|uniref:Diaminopimelate decarboxylase n=1 Tax=Mycobacterium heidelbergense TaxID=53376 RepID=A0A1X0DID6_MYCHE|nr:type II toxin-antitoxin system RelE/ParE family toxin [Mycobacterium heidelbergense]MCV7050562.1 type II toxin-antitoxin system RelE/ParE family toxin [Mycobacterium heidelbergense]ORA71952.1 diaminopimelate decarboxylase [Mycobacterium heidelbergense]
MRKWEVDLTLIEAWMDALDDDEYDNLIAALEQLEEHGPVTRRPFVDTIEGSKHPNMKELRPRATKAGAYIRVLFAFDIRSRAIMLIAGDKAGNWSKWYAKHIPIADDLFTAHQKGLHREEAEATKAMNPKARKGKKR